MVDVVAEPLAVSHSAVLLGGAAWPVAVGRAIAANSIGFAVIGDHSFR